MEVNAFEEMVNVLTPEQWYSIDDFATVAAYALRCADIKWNNALQFTKIIHMMSQVGFIEIDPKDIFMVRIKPVYFNANSL